VLFDAGGTLVGLHAARLTEALERRGYAPACVDTAFWRTVVLLDTEFSPRTGAFDNWWLAWQRRLAEHCEIPGEVFCEVYDELNDEAFLWDSPLDGAAECLDALAGAGVRLGVVSNADGRIASALERAGLADRFEVIVDSAVVGVEKPDPAIFSHALGPLGLEPDEAWYLGDTVTYDAAAADAAGLTSWVVDHRGAHVLEHPRRVRSLGEFADLALAALRR
jgi:putative hydrolase of the HAD superfamily